MRIEHSKKKEVKNMKNHGTILLANLLMLLLILSVSGTVSASDLILPASLTTIEAEAFMGDISLDSVTIPSGVTEIKARTFANSSLRTIYIPASVRSIAADAFAGITPDIYIEDINSLSGDLTGTVHLTQNSTLSKSLSYSNAILVVEEGVTLSVTGSLTGSDLQIHGTVINRGLFNITDSITTYGSGLFSVPDPLVISETEIPAASLYGGLNFRLAVGQTINVTSPDGIQAVTAITTGSTEAVITAGGQRARFCFVPAVSGSYTMASAGSNDTYGYLFDSSNNMITSNDDHSGDKNFSITYYMTAGTVYFYEVRYYHSDTTGTIPLLLSSEYSARITSHPTDIISENNESVSFHAAAEGTGLTYQWQRMLPDGNTWENTTLGGNRTDTLSFTASESYNGWKFRCMVAGSDGITVYSNAAGLYIRNIEQNLSIGANSAVILVGGDHAWLRFTPSVSGRYILTSTGSVDTKADLYDEANNHLAADDDSGEGNNFLITYDFAANSVYYFEVYFYNSSKVGTISLLLTVDNSTRITSHPIDIIAENNDTVSFHVTAEGIGLTYQWQRMLPDGNTWENTTLGGNRTDTLGFTASESYNEWQFRCMVTGNDGITVYSDTAGLYVRNIDHILSIGENSVEISTGGEHAWLRFVPRISGSYTLTSTVSADTKADLYDDSTAVQCGFCSICYTGASKRNHSYRRKCGFQRIGERNGTPYLSMAGKI